MARPPMHLLTKYMIFVPFFQIKTLNELIKKGNTKKSNEIEVVE